jgi:hypothetical protein
VTAPRFQLLTSAAPASGSSSESVAWRLLGANNRELGRSTHGFPDLATGRADLERLRQQLDLVESRLSISTPRGSWVWQLLLDGDDVARSARSFSRMRECRYSLEQFLEHAPGASVTTLQVGPRNGRVIRASGTTVATAGWMPAPPSSLKGRPVR